MIHKTFQKSDLSLFTKHMSWRQLKLLTLYSLAFDSVIYLACMSIDFRNIVFILFDTLSEIIVTGYIKNQYITLIILISVRHTLTICYERDNSSYKLCEQQWNYYSNAWCMYNWLSLFYFCVQWVYWNNANQTLQTKDYAILTKSLEVSAYFVCVNTVQKNTIFHVNTFNS